MEVGSPFGSSVMERHRLETLDDLVAAVPGLSGCVLGSVDGFEIARGGQLTDNPAHAAMMAAAIGLGRQLTVFGGGSRVRQMVIDHDGGLIVIRPIGDRRVFMAIASLSLDQLTLRNLLRSNAEWLQRLGE